MLYSRDHVWIDEGDPGNARVGITSHFNGSQNPVPILAPIDFSIVSFRADVLVRDINRDPEGAGYIAVVCCTDPAQLANLMSAGEYRDYCEGTDERWNVANNPVRCPPDPYIQGQTFAMIEGS